MVYLGYMLPTTEEYEQKIINEARLCEVSPQSMLEIIIDEWFKLREPTPETKKLRRKK